MSDTTTTTASQHELANDPINAYFAILLWYATGNQLVQITRIANSPTTAVSVTAGADPLTQHAADLSLLSEDPTAIEKMINNLETTIQAGFSTNEFWVKTPGAEPAAVPTQKGLINYGVALSVVGELFLKLRTTNSFGMKAANYDPGDPSCSLEQILGILPSKGSDA